METFREQLLRTFKKYQSNLAMGISETRIPRLIDDIEALCKTTFPQNPLGLVDRSEIIEKVEQIKKSMQAIAEARKNKALQDLSEIKEFASGTEHVISTARLYTEAEVAEIASGTYDMGKNGIKNGALVKHLFHLLKTNND